MSYFFNIFLIASFIFSCKQKVENSSSTDKNLYSQNGVAGTAQFLEAREVLASRCFKCHQHAAWSNYEESDFIAAGLVVPADTVNSSIVYKNQIMGGNMPLGGYPALTSDQVNKLIIWVSGISP